MPPSQLDIIRHRCRPLDPIPTRVEPVLSPLDNIGCVLFDVYGTLLISASGEVGTLADKDRAGAVAEALAAVGFPLQCAADDSPIHVSQVAARCLTSSITAAHQAARRIGIDHPEVDIRAIWRETLEQLTAR